MSDEKTEDPTPKRRREAREKGQVLKSKEVNIAILVLVMVYSLKWFGPKMYRRLFNWFVYIFSEAAQHPVTVAGVQQLGLQASYVLLMCLLPLFAAMYITAAAVELLQVGILFTGKPLQPQLERINPLKGVKRIVSLKSIVEFVKGFLKTLFVGYFVFKTIRENIPHIMMTMQEPLAATFQFVGDLIITIAKRVALAMVCLAGVDYFYQRWEFEKSLKMSKQEVKDEWKQAEGDPHIKGKMRQKMRQMARGGVKAAVQDSSAVVTNPTHYAVALKYENGMEAPIVKAKGEGHMAMYIKKVAEENDIPMYEDIELARALFKIGQVEEAIPPEFFMAVAKIVADIMKAKQKREAARKKAAQERLRSPYQMPGIGGTPPKGPPGAKPPGASPPGAGPPPSRPPGTPPPRPAQ